MLLSGAIVFIVFLCFSSRVNYNFGIILKICIEKLLPSLFPFMIAFELIAEAIPEGYNSKYIVFPVGVVFGFPIGASGASRLYSKGIMSKRDFTRLYCCGGIPGIGFFTGVLGSYFGLIDSVMLYIFSLTSSICFYEFSYKPECIILTKKSDNKTKSVPEVISGAIRSSSERMIYIFGFVSFFFVFGELISSFIGNETVRALIMGLFEFSSGVVTAGRIGGKSGLLICAFAVNFSGLSVFMQCYTSSLQYDVIPPVLPFLATRSAMALFSLFLTYTYIKTDRLNLMICVCIAFIVFSFIFPRLLQRIYRKSLKKNSI